MHRNRKLGTLTIPKGVRPEPHELRVAIMLRNQGKNVSFITPLDTFKRKTPDIYVDSVAWEIKGPVGNTRHTISRQIKKGSKQAKSIIIDSSRTKLTDKNIEKWLRADVMNHKSLQNIKLMTKLGKIIDIK